MQHQAYINASVDIRIPTEVESVNYNQIDKEREKIRKKAILNLYQRNVRAEYEEERKRRLRPWLYDGTPQKHSRDPYWFDVTYNQMFKKWSEA
ncbi:SA1788 family PVL leukocidin-associated protein [Staphylococcus aureus]|uniref:SA1788 family PVL leukocidin-associated protein n=1 Tax=Staphylococcus aureus TaxID=1280 RepID=UPI0028A07B42|nr:SA1788 family PVL leukocidin-associated protein [Staphylococcus aureus]